MDKFTTVSIIIPTINETDSLIAVVKAILNTCDHQDLEEFFFVVCEKTTPACLSAIQHLITEGHPVPMRVYNQSRPKLGPAIHEALERVKAQYSVYVAADYDTDPYVVSKMIAVAKEHPNAQICASRWLKGGGFVGYGRINKILNFLFQKWLQMLFFTTLTDITYGYRLFPVDMMLSVTWENDDFSFGVETYLKCLRLGHEFVEIPATWRAREQGVSQNTFFTKLRYIRTVLKVRFSRTSDMQNPNYLKKAD